MGVKFVMGLKLLLIALRRDWRGFAVEQQMQHMGFVRIQVGWSC